MAHIVRRATPKSSRHESPDQSDKVLAPRIHRNDEIEVESQLSLGLEPTLRLTWNVNHTYWADGFRLLVFRSETGFSAEQYPEDFTKHGQLIIETTHNDSVRERPTEGTHYYTFLLYKKSYLRLLEKMATLRISELVPSAQVGLGRMKDQLELRAMIRRNRVEGIEHTSQLNEAKIRRIHSRRRLEETRNPPRATPQGDATLAAELAAIDAMLATCVAKREKLESFQHDPKFKKLSKPEQDALMEIIEQRLDTSEISARREMRGS